MEPDYSYNCRVCGLKQEEKPWSGDRGDIPSYRICACCGVEFGVGDEGIGNVVERRREWLEGGVEWRKPEERPDEWKLDDQLSRIPPAYRFSRIIESKEEFRELYERDELGVLKRARIDSSVWLDLLDDDFETFAPLAAKATSLLRPVEKVLLESANEEVLRILNERDDLYLRGKVKDRLAEEGYR